MRKQSRGTSHDYGFDLLSVGNPSMNLSPILNKNKKVKYYIRMKTHISIVLRFFIRGDVNPLCVGLTHVSLVKIFPVILPQETHQQDDFQTRLS